MDITFKATKEQVLQMAAIAVNASVPMGLGIFHCRPGDYLPDDMMPYLNERGLFIDYFEGRMVKLNIRAKGGGTWSMNANPTPDYQSWATTYDARQLVEMVGGAIDTAH